MSIASVENDKKIKQLEERKEIIENEIKQLKERKEIIENEIKQLKERKEINIEHCMDNPWKPYCDNMSRMIYLGLSAYKYCKKHKKHKK